MKHSPIPGINVQWPWSQLLLSGKKSIETRSYKIPEKYLNVDLALIETPGRLGRLKENNVSTQIVGIVRFSKCFRYESLEQWAADKNKHLVPLDDHDFAFVEGEAKWAWMVSKIVRLERPAPAPVPRGIVFAKECKIRDMDL